MAEKKEHGMASVLAALGANVLVAISKFVAYILSGSAAMLNESIHSIVDCGNQVLLLLGDRKAREGVTELHPFGEARAKYFFSTVVAIMLFFAGGALGIMEASEKLFHPGHSMESPWLVISILVFGMIVECASLRVALKEIAALNTRHLSLYRFLRESRHSEVLIIFAEDTCAVIGLLLALAGTVLALLTGNGFYDALAGLLIGILLCLAAIFLLREFYSLMVGESMTESDQQRMRECFNDEAVSKLISLKTLHLSPTDILVTAKIEMQPGYAAESAQVVNRIEDVIRQSFEHERFYIYIETDVYEDNYRVKSVSRH